MNSRRRKLTIYFTPSMMAIHQFDGKTTDLIKMLD
jgi:hypothetical protein